MKKDKSKLFDWKGWPTGELPELEPHSDAKLKVLRDYVQDYITILCKQSFGVERFPITLVDGFSGGGVYADGKMGSPFALLQAVDVAEAMLNDGGRTKRITVDCEYHFVEKDAKAFDCLRHHLEQSIYKSRIGKNVFLHRGKFAACQAEIVARLKKRHPRAGGRAIFFLDQCGYKDVTPTLLRSITKEIKHAEYVINFAIEWLLDFIGDSKQLGRKIENLGLDHRLSAEKLVQMKTDNPVNWKYLVESQFGEAFRTESGSKYFSPFYIEPLDRHRGYWLLHLAPHERARSAMVDVQWRYANTNRHYGHVGMNMLAYKAEADQTGYLEGITFNQLSHEAAKDQLAQDFIRLLFEKHNTGVTFAEFTKLYCNDTVANNEMMAKVFEYLAQNLEVSIAGPSGGKKRVEKIAPNDVIKPCEQQVLVNIPRATKKK